MMASESTESRPEPGAFPPELETWLDEQASEHGVTRPELVVGLLEAYRTAVADGEAESRLDRLQRDIDSDLDDIRRRVVQVKQETDAKASADHTHEAFDELRRDLAALERRLDELESGGLGASGGDRAADTTAGELVDRLDDLEGKLTRVAGAVVTLRREGEQGVGTEMGARLTEIRRVASREGVEQAACDACGEQVSIALLPEPACPHCGAEFGGLSPGTGLFGKSWLTSACGDGDD